MKTSIIKFSESLPDYWERLQKPRIKMEQKAIIFEKKLQAEVRTEIAWDESAAGAPETRPRLPPAPTTPPEEQKSLRSNLIAMFQGVLGSFTSVAFNGVQILVVLVTVFLGVVFMLMNPRPIVEAILSIVPERHHNQAVVIMQNRKICPHLGLGHCAGNGDNRYAGIPAHVADFRLHGCPDSRDDSRRSGSNYLSGADLHRHTRAPARFHHGTQRESASVGGDLFHALMRNRLWCAGRAGRDSLGCNSAYCPQRALSQALSSLGIGRRPESSGRDCFARKAICRQVSLDPMQHNGKDSAAIGVLL